MSDQNFLNGLLVLSGLLLFGFVGVGVNSVYQDIRIHEIQYLNGTLEFQKIKDPQDKESKGLFLYLQKLDLERK